MEKVKEALEKGEAEIRVKRAGVYQTLLFKVVREETPLGTVPYLTADRFVDLPELVRIAEEYGMPVRAKNGKVLPRGKREMDFANL